MKHKIVKLSEAQYKEVLKEDFPFNYFGNESSNTDHAGEVMANVPYDSPDVNPEPTDTDKVGKTLSNNSWWNRHYGFNSYRV